jgi:hypothetical protein
MEITSEIDSDTNVMTSQEALSERYGQNGVDPKMETELDGRLGACPVNGTPSLLDRPYALQILLNLYTEFSKKELRLVTEAIFWRLSGRITLAGLRLPQFVCGLLDEFEQVPVRVACENAAC